MTTVRVPDKGPGGNKASRLFTRKEQLEDINDSIRVARADFTRWETAADDDKMRAAIAEYEKQIAAIEKEFRERTEAYKTKIAQLTDDAEVADAKLDTARKRLETLKAKKAALKPGGAFDRLAKLRDELRSIESRVDDRGRDA